MASEINKPAISNTDDNDGNDLATMLKRSGKILQRKQNLHLHSKEHVLADDLSQMMLEPKRFAAYLGIAELYKEADLRALARYVIEKSDLPASARGKYFFAALRGLRKRVRIKRKPAKKKKVRAKKMYGKNNSDRKRTK